MDFEMKFLSVFYVLLGAVSTIALVTVLISYDLAAMMLIVLPMFVGMWGLWVALRGAETD